VIRRLRLSMDGARGEESRSGLRPIRLLAVSDERAPSLDNSHNRDELAPLDAIVGAGDLEPDYLDFLAEAFRVPLLYVRGNHDRGAGWRQGAELLPRPLEDRFERIAGIDFVGLSWPGPSEGRAELDEGSAWWQSVGAVTRSLWRRTRPAIVISHVPPRGLGDAHGDPFHRGFAAYHWLCRTLQPQLWLHGHTTIAAATDWQTTWGGTTLVNVTGGVLIELVPAAADRGSTIARP
jgi:Icc-related predicted phosphoesterase